MKTHTERGWSLSIVAVMGMVASACGGGYKAPTNPSGGAGGTGSSGTVAATVTITANGATPSAVDVKVGDRVMFVNNDTRAHEILSTPHLLHTDCPEINAVGTLSPGQSKSTNALMTQRICGFHDHLDPDNTKLRGQLNVGTDQGPGPGYVRPY